MRAAERDQSRARESASGQFPFDVEGRWCHEEEEEKDNVCMSCFVFVAAPACAACLLCCQDRTTESTFWPNRRVVRPFTTLYLTLQVWTSPTSYVKKHPLTGQYYTPSFAMYVVTSGRPLSSTLQSILTSDASYWKVLISKFISTESVPASHGLSFVFFLDDEVDDVVADVDRVVSLSR